MRDKYFARENHKRKGIPRCEGEIEGRKSQL